MFMSKPKFDLDLFWSLPRCGGALTDFRGAYCAIGAAMKAMGYSDEYLCYHAGGTVGAAETLRLSSEERDNIWKTNDGYGYDGELYEVNPEKAKRMLIEALEGKVEFVSKEVTFKEEEAYAV